MRNQSKNSKKKAKSKSGQDKQLTSAQEVIKTFCSKYIWLLYNVEHCIRFTWLFIVQLHDSVRVAVVYNMNFEDIGLQGLYGW